MLSANAKPQSQRWGIVVSVAGVCLLVYAVSTTIVSVRLYQLDQDVQLCRDYMQTVEGRTDFDQNTVNLKRVKRNFEPGTQESEVWGPIRNKRQKKRQNIGGSVHLYSKYQESLGKYQHLSLFRVLSVSLCKSLSLAFSLFSSSLSLSLHSLSLSRYILHSLRTHVYSYYCLFVSLSVPIFLPISPSVSHPTKCTTHLFHIVTEPFNAGGCGILERNTITVQCK